MPLAALSFQPVFFLCLVQVLASLPTDPYFYPWREEPPSRRVEQYPQGREMWGQRNVSGGPGVYEYDQRGGNTRGGVGIYPQGQYFQVRSLEEAATQGYLNGGGFENVGPKNFGNSYSSHVKCGEESPKNVRTDMLGSEGVGRMDERINFDGTRSMRSGTKELDGLDGRIVNAKGGRRPPHGNKPPNAISTTEKASGNQTTKGSRRPRPPAKPPGGEIVFPDGYPKKFIPRVSKCAKKSTFCEHLGEEYPGEYISQVLKREGVMFREFFGKDMISDPNITERINAPEENSLCPYRQEVVFPRAAQNKEDKWLFIVNQDQYVQGVTVEVCLNPESRCILTEGFPLGYTPYCKQKYIERRLVAIGEDGKPHSDSFRLPSCCSCVVKHETSARVAPLRPPRTPGDLLP